MKHRILILATLGVCAAVVFGAEYPQTPPGPNTRVVSPGDHDYTIRVGDLDRRYTVHVPPGYEGKVAVPLVVMLHGGGGTSKGAATETGWGAKADAAGFLAVFPNALPEDATKPSSFSRNPQLWNDGSDRFHPGQKPVDDVGFIRAMLDQLSATFAVDARRIYFTGFSNGASMAFRVGAEFSPRIAAIAPVAGACWLETLQLERPVPMLYLTGTADPLNLIAGGVPKLATGASDKIRAKPKPPVRDSILKWVEAVGCPSAPRATTDANGVRTETYGPGRDGAEVIYVTVEGLGHTWPGGKSLLPAFLVGPRSDKLQATDFIWEFFQQHALSAGPRVPPRDSGAIRLVSRLIAGDQRDGKIDLGTGDHTRTVLMGSLSRRYRVYVPAKYDPANPTPVVVVFHGGGGNPESMVRLTGMNAKSEEAGFIVVYPYGSGLDPERGLTFNGGDCCGYAQQRKIDDVGFTRALLDDLAKVANVDPHRVFATGLSNGGIMSHYVASELSDRIAAIAPVGGPLMMDACLPKRPVSVMHFHGTADEFAPFKGGFGKGALGRAGVTEFRSVDHTIQSWVKANGCKSEPEIVALPDKADDGMKCTRKTWSGGKDGSEVVLIKIENGGHTWPGQKPIVAMLGPSTMDISANDLMWDFFQKHPLKPAASAKAESKP